MNPSCEEYSWGADPPPPDKRAPSVAQECGGQMAPGAKTGCKGARQAPKAAGHSHDV